MAIGPIDGGSLPLLEPESLKPLDESLQPKDATAEVGSVSFGDMFAELVASANTRGHAAHRAAVDLAEGRNDDIHGVMIELQKAGVEMRLVGSIKNKVVDAFYEIWRMNI